MKSIIGIAFVTIGLVTASAFAVLGLPSRAPTTGKMRLVPIPVHEKTQARLIPAAARKRDRENTAIIHLAQAMGPFWDRPGSFPGGVAPPFGPPPHGADAMGPFGSVQPPSPRADCEEHIDRLAGLVGYLKSKERLEDAQRAAWQKVEVAAEPGLARIRALCEELPTQLAQPPGLPARVDFAIKQMTARTELLRAIREPLQALYDTLKADQRTLLDMPPPLPRRPHSPPHRVPPPPPHDTL